MDQLAARRGPEAVSARPVCLEIRLQLALGPVLAGRHPILLIQNTGSGEDAWLMPYPANAATPPHRILQGLPAAGGSPPFSWMPDTATRARRTVSICSSDATRVTTICPQEVDRGKGPRGLR